MDGPSCVRRSSGDSSSAHGKFVESLQRISGRSVEASIHRHPFTMAMHFLDRLAEQPANDIAAFAHGQFINTVVWLLERKPREIDGGAMRDWREYEIANNVENGQGYTIYRCSGQWRIGQ